MVLDKAADTGMSLLRLVGELMQKKQFAGSLTEFAAATRVTPRVLISEVLRNQSYTPDLLHLSCSIFSGYYLTAVNLLSTVGGVSVVDRLDKLNPDRDLTSDVGRAMSRFGSGAVVVSKEDFATGLPWSRGRQEVSCEAIWNADKPLESVVETNPTVSSNIPGGLKSINEMTNAGVGKILEVKICSNGEPFSIPVTVALSPSATDSDSIVHILGQGSGQYTLKERYHGLKSGRLKFWRDVVFMQDIIDANTKTLFNDKSGYYADSLSRDRKNKVSGLLTLEPSMGTASAIFIMTAEDRRRAEAKVGAPFSNPDALMRTFQATRSMMWLVVDPDDETVDLYIRGIAKPASYTVRELRSASKSSGPDILEIIKAFNRGSNPVF